MTAKKCAALLLLFAIVGLLTWRVWPDGAQARRHQRDRALVQAVQADDLAAAARLLGEGADPNGRRPPLTVTQKLGMDFFCLSHRTRLPSWKDMDRENRPLSLLEVAIMRGNANMVGALLAKGADVRRGDEHMAMALDTAEMLQRLPETGSRNDRDDARVSALLEAATTQRRRLEGRL